MEVKQIPAMTVYCRQVRTNLINIGQYVGNVPMELMQSAQQQGLEIVAPQHWVYEGCDGNPETEFDLLIGIPVKESDKTKDGNFTTLRPFKCATLIHEGAWEKLAVSYDVLLSQMQAAGLKLSGGGREVYLVCDFENPTNNRTEIQMEIF